MSDQLKFASDSDHWYLPSGEPFYEVMGKNGKLRTVKITDAVAVGAVPSVTKILKVAAAPALENWKMQQTLMAALTLPRLPKETDQDFAKRVIEDSKAQAQAARERGTQLHTAIEDYIRGQPNLLWSKHISEIEAKLHVLGIDMTKGRAEHSFASEEGYGGKVDHNQANGECVVLDYKSKPCIEEGKNYVYDEHPMQIGSYGRGLGFTKFRGLSVFVGADDAQVRIYEFTQDDLDTGYEMFKHLLGYWKLKNRKYVTS